VFAMIYSMELLVINGVDSVMIDVIIVPDHIIQIVMTVWPTQAKM
jgi:hypothetical protein